MSVRQKLSVIFQSKVVQKLSLEEKVFSKRWSPKLIFLDNFFFEKIRLIFDIQNWLWRYNYGIFWQTVITRRIFLKIFSWWHVDSLPKNLLLRTHHLWNSMTELILVHTQYVVLDSNRNSSYREKTTIKSIKQKSTFYNLKYSGPKTFKSDLQFIFNNCRLL